MDILLFFATIWKVPKCELLTQLPQKNPLLIGAVRFLRKPTHAAARSAPNEETSSRFRSQTGISSGPLYGRPSLPNTPLDIQVFSAPPAFHLKKILLTKPCPFSSGLVPRLARGRLLRATSRALARKKNGLRSGHLAISHCKWWRSGLFQHPPQSNASKSREFRSLVAQERRPTECGLRIRSPPASKGRFVTYSPNRITRRPTWSRCLRRVG